MNTASPPALRGGEVAAVGSDRGDRSEERRSWAVSRSERGQVRVGSHFSAPGSRLACDVVGNRRGELRVPHEVGAVREGRLEAALELVLALRTGLEARVPALDGA